MNPFSILFRIFFFTLFTGGLWLIPALIFAVFAYFTLKTKTMYRWGHRIEGKTATKMGYVWTTGSVIFMLIFKVQSFFIFFFATVATGFIGASDSLTADHESIRQNHSASLERSRERFDLSEFIGTENGATFQMANRVMAGMVVTTQEGKIVSIVPIFQDEGDRVYFGETQHHGSQSHYLLAPSDCVVSNVSVCSGGATIEAIQLEYAKYVNDRLSPNGRSKSEWIGNPANNKIVELNPYGRFIGGIYLRQGRDTIGFQLLVYKASGFNGKLRTASTDPDRLKAMRSTRDDLRSPSFGRTPTFEEAYNQHQPRRSPFPPEASDASTPNVPTTVVTVKNEPKANNVIDPGASLPGANRTRQNAPIEHEDAFHGLGGDFDDEQSETMEKIATTDKVPPRFGQRDDLGVSEVAFPQLKFKLPSGRKMQPIGPGRLGEAYANHGPEGSLLVGFRVFFRDSGQTLISNVRPIYQSIDRYSYGETIGELGNEYSTLLLAKPGYVVSGIQASHYMGSLQVTYAKLDLETLELDWADQYQSERIGRSVGKMSDSQSNWPVVGLYGREHSGSVLQIGLVGIELDPKKSIENASGDSSRSNEVSTPLRSWKSSSGKYTIEARLKEFRNGKAVLTKPDGSTIEVDAEKLSKEDQQYLQNIN